MSTRAAGMVVATRDDLISLLEEAAELEHGLCCSYLYAAFSLKGPDDPTLTPAQAEMVNRWYRTVVGVATEEMLHPSLVANLLTAIGGTAHFSRPSLPQRSRYYPAGISISLRRFDDATLSRFMHLERPADMAPESDIADDDDIDLNQAPPEAPPGSLTLAEDLAGEPDALSTVGQLYQTIEDGYVTLDELLGSAVLFIGDHGAQADRHIFEFADLTAVTDLATARRRCPPSLTKAKAYEVTGPTPTTASSDGSAVNSARTALPAPTSNQLGHAPRTRPRPKPSPPRSRRSSPQSKRVTSSVSSTAITR
jgi:hypothetical protein